MGTVVNLLFTGLVINNTYGISVGLVLAGWGNGIGVTSSLIGLIAKAQPEDQAIATACSYLFRSLGSVIGLSFASSIVNQSLKSQLRDRLGDVGNVDEILNGVRQSLDYIHGLEPELRELVRTSYGAALTNGFGLMVAVVAGSLISACESLTTNLPLPSI